MNPFATAYEGLKFLCYFLAVWLTINLVNHGAKKGPMDYAFAVALLVSFTGALISTVAVVQAGLGTKLIYGFWQPYHSHQFVGPYVNRNHFAGYLEMALPLGMGLLGALIFLYQSRWQERKQSLANKQVTLILGVGLFVLLMFIGLLFSLSRGGIISASIVLAAQLPILLALLFRGKSLKKFMALGLAFVIITGITAWLIPWEKIRERLSSVPTESITTNVRFHVFMDTWNMSKNFPLFGSGMGSFERVFPRYKTWPRQGLFQHAHNDYLEFLAETGWLGFAALSAFFIWVAARGLIYIFTVLRSDTQFPGHVIARAFIVSGSLGAVFSILLHSAVDFNLRIPANALLFFVLCGITVAQRASDLKSR